MSKLKCGIQMFNLFEKTNSELSLDKPLCVTVTV